MSATSSPPVVEMHPNDVAIVQPDKRPILMIVAHFFVRGWRAWSKNTSTMGNAAQWMSAIVSLCTLVVVTIGAFRAIPIFELQLAKDELARAVLAERAAKQEKELAEQMRLAAEASQRAAKAEALAIAQRERALKLFRACALMEKAIQEGRQQVTLRIFSARSAGGLTVSPSSLGSETVEIPVGKYFDELLNSAVQAQTLGDLPEDERKDLVEAWNTLRERTPNTVSMRRPQPNSKLMPGDGLSSQMAYDLTQNSFSLDRAVDAFASQLVSTCFGLQLK